MENRDQNLQELMSLSFNYAYYKIGKSDVAKDISSQVIGLYLLSYSKQSSQKGWIINATKNFIHKYYKNHKKEVSKLNSYKNSLLEDINSINKNNQKNALKDAFKESFDHLSEDEMKTIMYYFQCNESIKQMHENLGISYSYLRKKISIIKKKIKAETYINLGFIGSKRIVTPKLNDLIVKFLQRFKKNLESGTLTKMYYYFSEIDLNNYNPTYEIKKIVDYDINLENNIYQVWVIYQSKDDISDMFYIKFYIDENNHLKIVKPPTKPKKLLKIDEDSEQGKKLIELFNSFPIDKTGRPNIPPEEIEKIVKEFEAKNKKNK